MTTITPTLEDLKRKTRRELQAIFRQAADASGPTPCAMRQTAIKTVDTARRALSLKPPGP